MALTLLHDLLHGSTDQWKQLTYATPQWATLLLHAFEQQKASPLYLFNNLFKIKEVCNNEALKPYLTQWMAAKALYSSNKSKDELAVEFLCRSVRKIQLRAIEQKPEDVPNVLMSLPSLWSLIYNKPAKVRDVLGSSMLNLMDMAPIFAKNGLSPEELLVRYNHVLDPMLHAYYMEHKMPATQMSHLWLDPENKHRTMGVILAYAGQPYLNLLDQMSIAYMWSIHTTSAYKEATANAYPDLHHRITQQAQQIWALFQVYSVTPTTYEDVFEEVEKHWQAYSPSLSHEAFEYTGNGFFL